MRHESWLPVEHLCETDLALQCNKTIFSVFSKDAQDAYGFPPYLVSTVDEDDLPDIEVYSGDDAGEAWKAARDCAFHIESGLVSNAFVSRLGTHLGPYKMKMLRDMNQTRDYRGKSHCASHTFCDANVFMDAAFSFVMKRERDATSTLDMKIINDAWAFARKIGAI